MATPSNQSGLAIDLKPYGIQGYSKWLTINLDCAIIDVIVQEQA